MSAEATSNENAEIVKLNVGGKRFDTSKSTILSQDTMLSTLISERWNPNKDKCVFIDRNGKHFDEILDFLRDGVISRPNTSKDLEELKREADYYSIAKLSKLLEQYEEMEIVKFDVGGKRFHTFKSTIMRRGTKLSKLLSEGRIPDKDGYIFIDRDGKYFGKILNFLRDGVIIPPTTSEGLKELRREAEFYSVVELSRYLDQLRYDQNEYQYVQGF